MLGYHKVVELRRMSNDLAARGLGPRTLVLTLKRLSKRDYFVGLGKKKTTKKRRSKHYNMIDFAHKRESN